MREKKTQKNRYKMQGATVSLSLSRRDFITPIRGDKNFGISQKTLELLKNNTQHQSNFANEI